MERLVLVPFEKPPFHLESSLKIIAEVPDVRIVYVESKNEEEWIKNLKDIEVAFPSGAFTKEMIDSSDKLRMIQTVSVGFNHIDILAALDKEVIVCNVPEVMSETVAQHTWALILALSKEIVNGDKLVRGGGWRPRLMGVNLWGKTLGIVGLGRIGRRVALKGKHAFDMRIIAYDPYVDVETAQTFGVEMTDLQNLMTKSDVVSINCPLSKDTEGLVGEKELSRMKETALIVNTARGKIIDQKALIQLLKSRKIRGAGLDVFKEEPIESDSPLLKMDNVILTPHIASSTVPIFNETARRGCENVVRYLRGDSPKWQINYSTTPWLH
ncbi:MAG: D-glycerate dehydrogenase [Candidatus Bathyarchaeota archaeon]|nr:MAG: D-glycerate dehydrogenase [Candidatus Bathyarchaeota archaeon]